MFQCLKCQKFPSGQLNRQGWWWRWVCLQSGIRERYLTGGRWICRLREFVFFFCVSLGAKEDARGHPVYRESMHDVYGEWNSWHCCHGSGPSWKVKKHHFSSILINVTLNWNEVPQYNYSRRRRIAGLNFSSVILLSPRLIEPINLEKAVDLYQKAAGVFEVNLDTEIAFLWYLLEYVL